MKFIFLILFIFCVGLIQGQDVPLKFNLASTKIDKENYHIRINGTVEKGWYVYAEDNAANELEGLRLNVENAQLLKQEDFLVDVAPSTITDKIFNTRLKIYKQEFSLLQMITINGKVPTVLKLRLKGFASNGSEFIPFDLVKEVALDGGVVSNQDVTLEKVDLQKPVMNCGEIQSGEKSLLLIFLIGFGGGLLALLTPCIFPMIPVTVSYFTNKSATNYTNDTTSPPVSYARSRSRELLKERGVLNAVLYGGSIFLIYVLASAPFHLMGNINPQIFNMISTNAWVNVSFFVVFILFALSFFGLFDIKLPARFANASGNKGGIFFLALTLVIVSLTKGIEKYQRREEPVSSVY